MASKKASAEYGYACDYCDGGRVRLQIRDRELIRIGRSGYVALERVPVGVCDRCKAIYYHASIFKQAEALLSKRRRRQLKVPVARYVRAG